MVIFPLTPDQTIAQMWSNGARGPAWLCTGRIRVRWAVVVSALSTDCRTSHRYSSQG